MQLPSLASALSFIPRAMSCCVLALLLCGCAILADRNVLVTTVPSKSPSPSNFGVVLTRSTRSIDFDGFQGQEWHQNLRISVINRGHHGFEVRKAGEAAKVGGRFAYVAPGTRCVLYSGEISNSTDLLGFPVNLPEGRTRCEFQVEVSNPAQFLNAIRVYLFKSSASM